MSDAPYDPASHYDRVTDAWTLLLGDDLHYGVFNQGDESLPSATAALTAEMVRAGDIVADAAVLDVGCGTGAPACHLAATLGARVTGITTSRVGVDAATERAASLGLGERVTFEVRDGTDNGLPSDSFDRVWVLESSHLMRDRDRLVDECARVLRPGGRMVLCDIMLQRPMEFKEVRRLLRPLTLLREVFGDARMEPMAVYAELATASGLRVEEQLDLTSATQPTFDRWRANAREYQDEVIASIGKDGWQQFVDSCDVLEGFWTDGTMGYGLIAASKPAAVTP